MALMRMRMAADGQKHATFRAADAADAACGCRGSARGSAHVPTCAAIASTTGARCRHRAAGPGARLCWAHEGVLRSRGRCIAVDPDGWRCPNPVGRTGVICGGHSIFVAMGVALMGVDERERLARARWECKEDLC
jgi:hypothetical protein